METIKYPIDKVLKIVEGQLYMKLEGTETLVPYIIGNPGMGKTKLINHIFSDWGRLFIHFAFTPIEEIGGLPKFSDIQFNGQTISGTTWTLPDLLTKLYDLSAKSERVLLVLDDMHLASPAHHALGYEIYSEHRLRGYQLPDNCAIMLIGNPSEKAGAKTMMSGIANRCSFYNVYMDYDYWKMNFALKNGINPKIISFLDNNSYRKYFHEEEKVNEPWCSPRSWTCFSNMITAMEEVKELEYKDILYYSSSHIGKSAASDFGLYYDKYSKINTKEVFENGIIRVPQNHIDTYIYSMAILVEFKNLYSKQKNKNNLLTTYTNVLLEIQKVSPEICISNLKEIVNLFPQSNVFDKLIMEIKNKNPELFQVVKKNINML